MNKNKKELLEKLFENGKFNDDEIDFTKYDYIGEDSDE